MQPAPEGVTQAGERLPIDLWWCDLRVADRAAALPLVTAAERAQAERLLRPAQQHERLCARAFVRRVLAHYCDLPPLAVPLAVAASGRPYVPAAALDFNLAHSGGWAVCAVTQAGHVGIDLERLRPVIGLAQVAAPYLTPAEQRAFAAAPLSEQTRLFLAAWTRHEAGYKTGRAQPPALLIPLRCPHPALIGHMAFVPAVLDPADIGSLSC